LFPFRILGPSVLGKRSSFNDKRLQRTLARHIEAAIGINGNRRYGKSSDAERSG
jgi:hypothetical protein